MTGNSHSGACSTRTLLLPVGVAGLIFVGGWALAGYSAEFFDNFINFGPNHHRARREALAQSAPAAFFLAAVQLTFLPVLAAVGIVLSVRLRRSEPWNRALPASLMVVTLACLASGASGLGYKLTIEAPALAEWEQRYADGQLEVFSLGGDVRWERREERQAAAREVAWVAFRHELPVPMFLTGYAALLLICSLRCRSPAVASPSRGVTANEDN
jgi:hypothetical protein